MAEKIKYYDVTEEQIDNGYWNFFCHDPTNIEAVVKTGVEMGVPIEIHRYGEICRFHFLNGVCEDRPTDKRWVGIIVRGESWEQTSIFMTKFHQTSAEMLKAKKV